MPPLNNKVRLEDSEEAWIPTQKTIFGDRTKASGFEEQQLSALEPSKRLSPFPPDNFDTTLEDHPGAYVKHGIGDREKIPSGSDSNSILGVEELRPVKIKDRENWSEVETISSSSIPSPNMSSKSDDPGELFKAAHLDSKDEPSINQLLRRVEELAAENSRLKQARNKEDKGQPISQFAAAYRWKTIYRIDQNNYLEEPCWIIGLNGKFILKGQVPILRIADYLERHEDIAFVSFKYYIADMVPQSVQPGIDENLRPPQPLREATLREVPGFQTYFPDFDHSREISASYMFWFYSRSHIKNVINSLPTDQKLLIELFRDWIEAAYENEWSYIDSQFRKGLVSPLSMKYLIQPGDIIISLKDGRVSSYMARGWTESIDRDAVKELLAGRAESAKGRQSAIEEFENSERSGQKLTFYWSVDTWAWDFRGSFRKVSIVINLKIVTLSPHSSMPISAMDVYPLRYGDEGLKALLRKRGQTYWKCRDRKLVSYADRYSDETNVVDNRYMVDVATYYQFRRRKQQERSSSHCFLDDEQMDTLNDTDHILQDTMSSELLGIDEFPDIPELLVFPSTVIAYDLRRKIWADIDVDQIRNVSWNKKAFDNLAMDDDGKELIQALVTNQIASSKATDVIADKGNGLIMLLHGGPGTGKTFTAEGVADFAEKPLYRVTCGDIGTNPEAVETYLESVLHLGSIWDCVVLLDEADVFLEERGQSDLARNALVSVFLRVLEYYQGILILTSNRVGTFDEAFKSRIQLSLHYDKLNKSQRRKIWRNFIERLRSLGETNVEYDDIYDHIDELVGQEMNGREIRNVITTARQLAQYRGKNLCYAHLKHVMDIAGRFDTYLQKVKDGRTHEELAREDGVR